MRNFRILLLFISKILGLKTYVVETKTHYLLIICNKLTNIFWNFCVFHFFKAYMVFKLWFWAHSTGSGSSCCNENYLINLYQNCAKLLQDIVKYHIIHSFKNAITFATCSNHLTEIIDEGKISISEFYVIPDKIDRKSKAKKLRRNCP